MSLVENINKRRKAGTSRSKSKGTVSPKAYAKMKAGYRSGGMVKQMSEQMDVPKEKAGGLMKKAAKMNKAEDFMESYKNWAENKEDVAGMNMGGMMGRMNRNMGGSIMLVSLGSTSPMRRNREEYSEDSTLIKSTENQVRARHFNNNGGKGTF